MNPRSLKVNPFGLLELDNQIAASVTNPYAGAVVWGEESKSALFAESYTQDYFNQKVYGEVVGLWANADYALLVYGDLDFETDRYKDTLVGSQTSVDIPVLDQDQYQYTDPSGINQFDVQLKTNRFTDKDISLTTLFAWQQGAATQSLGVSGYLGKGHKPFDGQDEPIRNNIALAYDIKQTRFDQPGNPASASTHIHETYQFNLQNEKGRLELSHQLIWPQNERLEYRIATQVTGSFSIQSKLQNREIKVDDVATASTLRHTQSKEQKGATDIDVFVGTTGQYRRSFLPMKGLDVSFSQSMNLNLGYGRSQSEVEADQQVDLLDANQSLYQATGIEEQSSNWLANVNSQFVLAIESPFTSKWTARASVSGQIISLSYNSKHADGSFSDPAGPKAHAFLTDYEDKVLSQHWKLGLLNHFSSRFGLAYQPNEQLLISLDIQPNDLTSLGSLSLSYFY